MENTDVNIKNWKTLIKPAKLDIKLSDDKVEEGKIFDFIDMKCGQGWEIKGFDNREVILQKNKLSK